MRKIIKGFKTPEDKIEFDTENIRFNIRNATALIYFIIVFEVMLIMRMLVIEARPFSNDIVGYLCCYIFLLAASVIVLIGIKWKKHSETKRLQFIYKLTTIYEFCFLLWAVAVTILDSHTYERYIVYLTIVVCMTSILNLRPWVFLSIEIGGYFLLNVGLCLQLNRLNASSIINLTVFTVIFVVISISKYNSSIADYYNKKKIRQLNEMLQSEKERYKSLAKTDQLTGLFNRNILKRDMKERIAANYKAGKSIGVAMFDLDDFKKINDTYGHAIGDECLKELGQCFRNHTSLKVYRYGGEEFLAVCDGVSEDEFVNIVDHIVKNVSTFKLSVETLEVTISAGYVYCVPKNECCDENIINAADKALYEAKKRGKNRFVKGAIDFQVPSLNIFNGF